MSTPLELDRLLEEALEHICAAADHIRQLDELDDDANIGRLGKAIWEIGEVRDHLFTVYPDLQPESSDVGEMVKVFKERFESARAADALLEAGDLSGAKAAYEENSSYPHGYFRMEAEAALYRINQIGTS